METLKEEVVSCDRKFFICLFFFMACVASQSTFGEDVSFVRLLLLPSFQLSRRLTLSNVKAIDLSTFSQ